MIQQLKERILFVNDDVLIINKLAGEAMEGAKHGIVDLPKMLETEYGTVHAVHRLDVPVTGCALFARNAQSAAFLCSKISSFKKLYWAIVELSPKFDKLSENGELIHYIETNSKTNAGYKYPANPHLLSHARASTVAASLHSSNKSCAFDTPNKNRKEAKLRYKILGKGSHYGFMEIELITGRHHQIRAQLAAVGVHIKGDLKYGAKRSEKEGGFRLHAYSLTIPNPSIHVSAMPPNMDNLWQAFPLPHIPN